MSERAIIYIDSVFVHVDHDDAKDLADGWEIHVRDSSKPTIDILHLAPRTPEGWNLRHHEGECWGIFKNVGDAFMQALDPVAPETIP